MQKKGVNHSGNHKGNTTESKTTKDIFICMSHLWLNGHKMIDFTKFIEMEEMFHGNYVIVARVQPIVEIITVTTDANVVDVNVTTRNKATEKQVFKDRESKKQIVLLIGRKDD